MFINYGSLYSSIFLEKSNEYNKLSKDEIRKLIDDEKINILSIKDNLLEDDEVFEYLSNVLPNSKINNIAIDCIDILPSELEKILNILPKSNIDSLMLHRLEDKAINKLICFIKKYKIKELCVFYPYGDVSYQMKLYKLWYEGNINNMDIYGQDELREIMSECIKNKKIINNINTLLIGTTKKYGSESPVYRMTKNKLYDKDIFILIRDLSLDIKNHNKKLKLFD